MASAQVGQQQSPASGDGDLQKGLKQRHLTMIAIGGVIGAGLFVGSGAVIQAAGPAAFLTYAITGLLIIMVMRMLGEMATANPSTGSFADYARSALGNWAGFSVGWLYWYFWVIVVGFEAVAGAQTLRYWIDAPLWLMAFVLMALMTATNLFSVKSYGEFEYWFASIKVAAIIAFMVIGAAYVFGLFGGRGVDFSNLTAHGGFAPHGVGAMFSGIVVVIFSMVGAEIATIAAAESHDPAKAIAKATQSVIFRIGIFYVGSIFLLVTILPWNDASLGASPYVAAFTHMGIPYADSIMNFVVLTAVLSCLNSGLYTASRMLFVLGARREAPLKLITVNSKGVPVWAILGSSAIGFACVIAAYLWPETVFSFLLNSSGAVILFVYLIIVVSQYVLRRRTPDADLPVKMWAFPTLTILTGVAMVGVLVQMAFNADTRSQLLLSLLSLAVVLGLYAVTRSRHRAQADAAAAAATTVPHPERILVLANRTMAAQELRSALLDIPGAREARYLVVVPANPVDTGQAMVEGAAYVWEATEEAARERLNRTLEILRTDGLDVAGEIGDYRPLKALSDGIEQFAPDQLVISTQPEDHSTWLANGVVAEAQERFDIPLLHVTVAPLSGSRT